MAKKSANRRRPAPLFETLEPRLLLSAEGLGAVVADAGLDHDLELPQDGAEFALLHTDDGAQAESATLSRSRELVFVDPPTPDHEQLVNDLLAQAGSGRQMDVILLDAEADILIYGCDPAADEAGQRLVDALTVTNTDNSGGGSLRDAITLANANAGADTIAFNSRSVHL